MSTPFFVSILIGKLGTVLPNLIYSVIEVVSLRLTAASVSTVQRTWYHNATRDSSQIVQEGGCYATHFLGKPGVEIHIYPHANTIDDFVNLCR